HTVLLPELMSGFDRCLQHYIINARSGCGSRSDFIPAIPALTRCTAGSKLSGVSRKKDKLVQRRKPQVGTTNEANSSGIP
ncbi:hypothetical protein Q8G46_28245, partial [Klebsiella pneumoniae]|uniref:hypothetical protein n=1 Tax=Klebsiella pneumoniae TaxID=573 RepID=UPI0030132823